jgi:ADP-dependent NAD(P)H-hydrate dehydratase / NAD(P)H-hydrate epimerase
VAACDLARAGREVRLYLAPRHALADDELASFLALGGAALLHTGAETLAKLEAWLAGAALVVDGLLGIGARGAPRPPLNEIITLLNRARAGRRAAPWVLAIDVPSGVDADSGAAVGDCVVADATVVLGGLKVGLLRAPASELAGVLFEGDIGIPAEALEGVGVQTLGRGTVRAAVPTRSAVGHKGTFGRVLIAAGSPDYFGAPYLAGAAAARSGCGLLGFAAAPALQAALAGLLPEATYTVLPEGAPAQKSAEAASRANAALADAHALVIGPGLGRTDGAHDFVCRVLARRAGLDAPPPVVVDADALYVLATDPSVWSSLGRGVVVTPHHAEMARLTGAAVHEIAADPWGTALDAASRWGVVVVLKGPFTVVAVPEGQAWVLPHANPALATGGTGDVLAGTIAGLLAQGCPPAEAACLGVYVHGAAAHAVLARGTRDLLLASDLLPELPRALAALRAERGDRGPAPWAPWTERL